MGLGTAGDTKHLGPLPTNQARPGYLHLPFTVHRGVSAPVCQFQTLTWLPPGVPSFPAQWYSSQT